MNDDLTNTIAVIALSLLCGCAGVLLFRRAVVEFREFGKVRKGSLLYGVDQEKLTAEPYSRWPVRGRWPGPKNHVDEFRSPEIRVVYALIAEHRAANLRVVSEVLLIIGSALLGTALPTWLSTFSKSINADVSQIGSEAADPGHSWLHVAVAPLLVIWSWRQLLAVILVIMIAIAVRAAATSRSELAAAYRAVTLENVNQNEPQPTNAPSLVRRLFNFLGASNHIQSPP